MSRASDLEEKLKQFKNGRNPFLQHQKEGGFLTLEPHRKAILTDAEPAFDMEELTKEWKKEFEAACQKAKIKNNGNVVSFALAQFERDFKRLREQGYGNAFLMALGEMPLTESDQDTNPLFTKEEAQDLNRLADLFSSMSLEELTAWGKENGYE